VREAITFPNVLAVLSLIVGLPSVLALFFDRQEIAAVLVLLLVAGVIGGVLFWRWHTKLPPVTVMSTEGTLTFEDKDARIATQQVKMRVRANHNGVQRFMVAEARGDGPVKDILIDDEHPTLEEVMDTKRVYKVFHPPLRYREEQDVEASFRWEDSFSDKTESWRHSVAHKTKQLSMTIEFHPDRMCKGAKAMVSYASEPQEPITEGFSRSPKGRKVELKVPNPKLGGEYVLEWDW